MKLLRTGEQAARTIVKLLRAIQKVACSIAQLLCAGEQVARTVIQLLSAVQ